MFKFIQQDGNLGNHRQMNKTKQHTQAAGGL